MAGLVRNRSTQYQRIPGPEGMTGEQASSVYLEGSGAYPELEVPATHYATAVTALKSIDVNPTVLPSGQNSTIVRRGNWMFGYKATGGRQAYIDVIPPINNPVYSSKFQPWLIGPIVNFIQNLFLYRAGYPAASVMLGGMHNLALSTRVDQLTTRSSGGPGQAAMTPSQRRFSRVQTIPRFSTMPQAYPTQAAPG